MGSNKFFVLGLLLLLAVALEGLSFATSRVLAARGVFYEPTAVPDFERYLARRDGVLGWPANDDPAGRDVRGSRIVPAFPDPAAHSDCASLYGDSFTWASEVSDEDAWGNRVSRALGCRVANFGVPGYGSDQAFLRYRGNSGDHSRVVVLSHLSENVLRNVNQYRALLYAGSLYGLKPRFVLGPGGALREIPLPGITSDEYPQFVNDPGRFLRHEFFVPDGPSGIRTLGFPYTLSVASAFRHFHIQAQLRGVPWYADFYSPDHPSRGLPVTTAIIEGFVREANQRQQTPLPVILPTRLDFEYQGETGNWPHQPLIDALEKREIVVLDVAPALQALRGDRPLDALFSASGHYTVEGNALVAEIVAARLARAGFGLRTAEGRSPSTASVAQYLSD